MFDVVRAILDAWVMATMLAATWWVVTDFDVRSSREWAAGLIMVPAMIWSFTLAMADVLPRVADWAAPVCSGFAFVCPFLSAGGI